MRARVLFADSSRAKANKLNDLYERWQLRYEEEEKVQPNAVVQTPFVDYTSPQSIEVAHQMSEALIKRKSEIEKWLGAKSYVDERGNSLSLAQYHAHRNLLKDELTYVTACRRMLKATIAEWNRQIYSLKESVLMNEVRAISEKEGDVWFIQQAYTLLITLHKKHNFELEETDKEIFNKLKRRLLVWAEDQ